MDVAQTIYAFAVGYVPAMSILGSLLIVLRATGSVRNRSIRLVNRRSIHSARSTGRGTPSFEAFGTDDTLRTGTPSPASEDFQTLLSVETPSAPRLPGSGLSADPMACPRVGLVETGLQGGSPSRLGPYRCR